MRKPPLLVSPLIPPGISQLSSIPALGKLMDLPSGTSAWATDDRHLMAAVWPSFRFPFGLSVKEELARTRDHHRPRSKLREVARWIARLSACSINSRSAPCTRSTTASSTRASPRPYSMATTAPAFRRKEGKRRAYCNIFSIVGEISVLEPRQDQPGGYARYRIQHRNEPKWHHSSVAGIPRNVATRFHQ
jgi:hypothetical protein